MTTYCIGSGRAYVEGRKINKTLVFVSHVPNNMVKC